MTDKNKKPNTQDKEPVNCACCGEYIKGDSRSTSNPIYCDDCG